MIAVSGVLRSCEMLERNCVLSASRSRRSAIMLCASASSNSRRFSRSASSYSVLTSGVNRVSAIHALLELQLCVGFLNRLDKLLPPEQRPVPAFRSHELIVLSLFNNLTLVQYDNP